MMRLPSLVLLASTVVLAGCSVGTPLEQRMVAAADTVAGSLERAREELDSLREEIRTEAFAKRVTAMLESEASDLDRHIDRTREALSMARRQVDVAKFEKATYEVRSIHDKVALLRRAVFIVEEATKIAQQG